MTTEQHQGLWYKKANDEDEDAVCAFEQETVDDWFAITTRLSASLSEFETDFFERNTVDGGLIDADSEWGECDGASALTAFATAVTVSFAAISF